MIGVRDLTRHLLFIAKEKGFKEHQFYKSSLEKVVFVAFLFSLKHNLDIRYDVLFYKSNYGVTSDEVKELFGERYGRHISHNSAKECHAISQNKKLSEVLENLMQKEVTKPFTIVPFITQSEVFLASDFKNRKKMSKNEYDYKIWTRDESVIWTLAEIALLAEVEKVDEMDLRIPLKRIEFEAIKKYITLENMWVRDEKSKLELTFDDILTLRSISDSIIESARKHGYYIKEEI